VLHFQQSNKIGILSKYTIAIYFPQNDPNLLTTAHDIRSRLIKYGFSPQLVLTQGVSDAFLRSVVPPKGNEIRYQLNEVEAAAKLKSILSKIFPSKLFTTRLAQGKDKQTVISIFLFTAPATTN
jgi:hypothetical protein